ncbi:hypothetical protein MMC25_001093 [Agyrium rufum]|nr:hypothetical protein [Agyrium rufum]
MMSYFSTKKATTTEHIDEAPVLTEEDEAFLQRVASEGEPPPLPTRPLDLPEAGSTAGNDAQLALLDGAQNVALPDVPDTPDEAVATSIEGELGSSSSAAAKGKERAVAAVSAFRWSFLRRDSRDRNRSQTATGLHDIAEGLKAPDAQPNEDGLVEPHEANKEEEEMTHVLEQLNLAAVNNRVFSISKESTDLLKKFTLVLKDLMNGVPTAYGDLESLLTNSERQLQQSFSHLPTFLQKLIESLPSKFTSSLGPEMAAAAAEKPSLLGSSAYLSQAASAASAMGMKVRVPNLKDLVTKPGAISGMLRSIMTFLRTRFPAFMGMNVLWSLALFVLLFVFWYCHKRGKEVRLEKERALTEKEVEEMEKTIQSDPDWQAKYGSGQSQSMRTTAPEGASLEELKEGIKESQEAEKAEGQAQYAAGGSLAKELQKEEEEKAKAQSREESQNLSTGQATSAADIATSSAAESTEKSVEEATAPTTDAASSTANPPASSSKPAPTDSSLASEPAPSGPTTST